MNRYDHKAIEKKWQDTWEKNGVYTTPDTSDKENFYTLVEFPYPSGNLHVGHWYAFAVSDIYARFMRTQNKNVLFPIGFDAFGLPAENAAIKHKLDPREWTEQNMAYMEKQLKSMGATFDWDRKLATCDPAYYKWTQWIFTQFLENGLAYQAEAPVNWCDSCKTILANEQVIDGKCDRCGNEVIQKQMKQWMLRITDFAEDLLSGLDTIAWADEIKASQRNWIGRSQGASITFKLKDCEEKIDVFTTRPDTIFGATYMVIAPEHPLVGKLDSRIKNISEVRRYIEDAKKKTEIERTDEKKEKTGIVLEGVVATNPANSEDIPVYVSDYVLVRYGTGAIMAVPAHDERDFEFAKKHNLPIRKVTIPLCIDDVNPHVENKEVVFRNGILAVIRNPKTDKFLCLKWKQQPWTTFVIGGIEGDEDPLTAAKREVLEETGYKNIKLVRTLCGPIQSEFFAAHKDVNRVLHSWSMLFELENEEVEQIDPEELEKHEVIWLSNDEIIKSGLRHAELPYILESLENGEKIFTGHGVLINSGEFDGLTSEVAKEKLTKFVGGKLKNNYHLRDWSVSRQRYWGCPIPVVYDPEGKPHPVPKEHLPWILPSDVDPTPTGVPPLAKSEELKKRTVEIFGEGWTPEVETFDTFIDSSWYFLRYLDSKNEETLADTEILKKWMPVDFYSGGAEHTTMHLLYSRFFMHAMHKLGLINFTEPFKERLNRALILGPDGNKMSKSKGNVIDPDEIVERLGSDTVRLYLAFIGPYNEVGSYPWNPDGVVGMRRFIERVWRLQENIADGEVASEVLYPLNQTIKKVTEDFGVLKFNTAIAKIMSLANVLEKTSISKEVYQTVLQLLAPIIPHITEELWELTGGEGSIHGRPFPVWDEAYLTEDIVTIAVQVNGKIRAQFTASRSLAKDEIERMAFELPEIAKWTEGKTIVKTIVVPQKLVSFVVKD